MLDEEQVREARDRILWYCKTVNFQHLTDEDRAAIQGNLIALCWVLGDQEVAEFGEYLEQIKKEQSFLNN